jgi:hypothetical protein
MVAASTLLMGIPERAGHFMREAKLTFKLSLFKFHPLNKRPYHSFTYQCIYQNPGGWVGSFPHIIAMHM